MLIRGSSDERILVNGGSNSEVIRYLTKIFPFYSKRLDYVICTDGDYRNSSGLIDVINRFRVKELLVPAHSLPSLGLASTSDQTFDDLLEKSREKGVNIRHIEAGQVIKIGNIILRFHFPKAPESFSYSKSSPPEAVFSVSYEDVRVLIAGNSSKKVQNEIALYLDSGTDNVLIYSHSDAPNLVSESLVKRFRPKFLIYSKTITKKKQEKGLKETNTVLSGILSKYRFNIKQDSVRIVIRGKNIEVSYWK